MFCPKCRVGYNEGISNCADCNTKLVPKLTKEPEIKTDEFEVVLSTNDIGQIAFVKSLFDGHNIKYIAQGDHFTALAKLPQFPVRFMVPKSQFKDAKELLKDLGK